MRRKILDAAYVFLFCVSLIAVSNIQENNAEPFIMEKASGVAAESSTLPGTVLYRKSIVSMKNMDEALCSLLDNDMVTGLKIRAGICNMISEYSFTTESDEETGIEKNNIEIVTTPVYENRWNIELTEEEIDLLARIIWLEARGEGTEGEEAVVEVVFNRMASDLYPNTLYEVLSQNHPVQFVSWKNRDKAVPTEMEYESIYNVLNGNTNLLRDDTLYFSTFMMTSNLDVKINNHYFCY